VTETATRTKIVKSLRGGQVTIPVEFREELGIHEDSLLKITLDKGELHIVPLEVRAENEGSEWLQQLYEYFAPVRQKILESGISEEELVADIEAAVAEVRAEKRKKK
jgi:AbrB family looped-hinge helix DNA binding protein